MASKATLRPVHVLVKRAKPRCEFAPTKFSHTTSIRRLSASTRKLDEAFDESGSDRPRWSYTPERTKMPFPVRITDPDHWEVNNDPKKLDQFYIRFLGIGGDRLLDEETKFLAITHKSYDQGRRGFNDRLAFLGRRIVNLQANLVLVNGQRPSDSGRTAEGVPGREPFEHPALEGLQNLNTPLAEILTKHKLAKVAHRYRMREIIRWKPRFINNMDASGLDVVLNTTLYAIVGALALQRGGDIAAEVTREKILKPMGIS